MICAADVPGAAARGAEVGSERKPLRRATHATAFMGGLTHAATGTDARSSGALNRASGRVRMSD
jgi:hypothetical protein